MRPVVTKSLKTDVLCFSQIGKEHLGLKAITEVLQDLQYKVRRRLEQSDRLDDHLLHQIKINVRLLCRCVSIRGRARSSPASTPTLCYLVSRTLFDFKCIMNVWNLMKNY